MLLLAIAGPAHPQAKTREVLGFGADAPKRVALMIGNGDYASVGRLDNPINDATDIGKALESVGFTVEYRYDLGRAGTINALQQFRKRALGAEAAVVYYAGHGIEVDKQNFMIPVDATLQSADDIDFEAVKLDLFLRSVLGARKLKLVIVDACRNNPFRATMRPSSIASRAIGRGLRAVEPVGNTLVAYAAREGTVASDGDGRNSPYAVALVKALETEGLEIGKFFRQVRDEVLAVTGNAQEPFFYGSLSSDDFFFRPPGDTGDPPVARDPPGDPPPDGRGSDTAIELAFWKTVTELNRPEGYRAYLNRYPDGNFAAVARLMLEVRTDPPDGRNGEPDDSRDDDPNNGILPPDLPPASHKVFDSRDGYHIIGMDIRGSERLGISYRACVDLCTSLARCQAFSYNQARRGCYPKTGIRRIERYSGVTSGAVKELSGRLFARADTKPERGSRSGGGGLERNTDFPGRDLGHYGNGVRDVSLSRCREICLGDRRCRAYTYVPDQNWCFPKSSVSRRRPERRAISEQLR